MKVSLTGIERKLRMSLLYRHRRNELNCWNIMIVLFGTMRAGIESFPVVVVSFCGSYLALGNGRREHSSYLLIRLTAVLWYMPSHCHHVFVSVSWFSGLFITSAVSTLSPRPVAKSSVFVLSHYSQRFVTLLWMTQWSTTENIILGTSLLHH